jgi:hypothetical protein
MFRPRSRRRCRRNLGFLPRSLRATRTIISGSSESSAKLASFRAATAADTVHISNNRCFVDKDTHTNQRIRQRIRQRIGQRISQRIGQRIPDRMSCAFFGHFRSGRRIWRAASVNGGRLEPSRGKHEAVFNHFAAVFLRSPQAMSICLPNVRINRSQTEYARLG